MMRIQLIQDLIDSVRGKEKKSSQLPRFSSYNKAVARIKELEAWHKRLTIRDQMLQRFCANSEKILAVMNKIGDEKSRIAYKNEVVTILLTEYGLEISQRLGFTISFEEVERQRESINPADYPDIEFLPEWNFPTGTAGHAFAYPQYEYEDKICLKDGDIFLDCGSCAGEVSVWAQNKVGKAGRVYAFEPSPLTYELLKRNISKFAPEVQPLNYAIGDSNEPIQFSNDAVPWSKVNADSALSVPMLRIDEFCKERGLAPTFIKMDIEGFELEGLKGAANTVKKHRPDLAICTYHLPEHIWEVGCLISELCPDYVFYFSKHQPFCEAVLFATVNN